MPDLQRNTDDRHRLRVVVRGAVQGVGFRPFIFRLASELHLDGWVLNSAQGVYIEVEGARAALDAFLLRVEPERPPSASIQSLESTFLDPAGLGPFEIRHSDDTGPRTTLILPDLATCPACLAELFDHRDRRYRYPFINCTHCGPRYSIVEALPYDRPNTTMKAFRLCDACRAEYEDPADRRFHAQPTACANCGPCVELWAPDGTTLAERDDALRWAEKSIRSGEIVAIKGLGGFHLVCDARNEDSVRMLRERKRREEKPLAVMAHSLEATRALCELSPIEERMLASPQCPVLLAKTRDEAMAELAPSIAQAGGGFRNPCLGVMLPYTPLHHLVMRDLGFPIVATSGNLSDEPICTDEHEALTRLRGIADLFLVHNRPIARHVDDSVARVILGGEQVLRRARGYAPLPFRLPASSTPTVAVGAHLKNAVCVTIGDQAFVSQHIGDLETEEAFGAFERVIGDLTRLYEAEPAQFAHDLHPDYLSTQFAIRQPTAHLGVQHHHAHVLACMADNDVIGPVLGVSWDGTGYGTDGTVWGGEFLRVTSAGFERAAHLRTFRLPGGDRAVKEPRRSALGLLYEMLGDRTFTDSNMPAVRAFGSAELPILKRMLTTGTNSPITSSAGRLFDAVAAILGLHSVVRHEGQAAMELEFASHGVCTEATYSARLVGAAPIVVDWEETVRGILYDIEAAIDIQTIAAKFHNALADMIVAVAVRIGEERVALTGGCFQNRILTERTAAALHSAGFRTYVHQRVPPNDGGIALGQAMACSPASSGSSAVPAAYASGSR